MVRTGTRSGATVPLARATAALALAPAPAAAPVAIPPAANFGLRASDLPTFEPRTDLVPDWLFSVRALFNAHAPQLDGSACVSWATTQLRGSAITWWRAEHEAGRAADILAAEDPWSAFSEAICDAFAPADAHRLARDRLRRLQHLRSVSSYVDQLRRAFIDIGAGNITADEQLDRFISGLRAPYAAHVRSHCPATFADAVKLALAYESSESHAVPIAAPQGLRHRRMGSFPRGFHRRFPGRNRRGPQTVQSPSLSGLRDRRSNFGPLAGVRSIRRCYNCGKPGHLARNCRFSRYNTDAGRGAEVHVNHLGVDGLVNTASAGTPNNIQGA